MKSEIQKKMLSRKEVSQAYGLAQGTLANLLSQRKGPKAYRVGRRIFYAVEDLEEFFKFCPILTVDSVPRRE